MDFHSLPRRDLQSLCKKNRIPANMTNVAMADALQSLQSVEGIGEIQESLQFQSPTKAELMSPALPRTSRRTSTRKPPATLEPKEGQASPLPRSRRVAVKASEIMRMAEVGEEGEKQEGTTTKKVVLAETPRAPATRRRAAKKEEGGKAAAETPAPTTRRRAAKKEDKVETLDAETRKVEAVKEEKATVVLKTYQRSTRRQQPETRAAVKMEALVLEEDEDREEKAVEESAASVDEKKSSEEVSEEETKLPVVETAEESSGKPLEAVNGDNSKQEEEEKCIGEKDEELGKECFEEDPTLDAFPVMENLIAEEEKKESAVIEEDEKLGNEEAEEEKEVPAGNGDQQLETEQPNPEEEEEEDEAGDNTMPKLEESPIRGLIEEDPSSNPGNKQITTEEEEEEGPPTGDQLVAVDFDLSNKEPFIERVLEFKDAQIPPVDGAESGGDHPIGEIPAEIQEEAVDLVADGLAGGLAVEFNDLTLEAQDQEEAVEGAMQAPPPSDPIKPSDSASAAAGYPEQTVGPAVTAGGGEAEVKDKAEERTVQDLKEISLRKLKSMYKEKMEGKKRPALVEINDNCL